jgi:hypothetical protein
MDEIQAPAEFWRTTGIDIGNESHYVAVPAGRDASPVREFGSWMAALEETAQWLKAYNIQTAVMQSTGVYWMSAHDCPADPSIVRLGPQIPRVCRISAVFEGNKVVSSVIIPHAPSQTLK